MRPALGLTLILAATSTLCAAPPVVPGAARLAADPVARGEVLLGELNCVACHQADGAAAERIIARTGPSLADVGSRLSMPQIRDFVSSPSTAKPGTTMPHVFTGGAGAPQQIGPIAAYLASLKTGGEVAAADLPSGNADRGRTAYHTVGCVACHAPEDGYRPAGLDDAVETPKPGDTSVPIALGRSYPPEALTRFLLDPLAVRPSGRMPSMKLSPQAAADIAAYLQVDGGQHRRGHHAGAAAMADMGRQQFVRLRCTACHDTGEKAPPIAPATPLSKLAVDSERSCIAAKPLAGAPHFPLSDDQRAAVTAALRSLGDAKPMSDEERITRTFAAFNCYACHRRGEIGGPAPGRDAFFTSVAELDLGDEGRLAPALTGVGYKLTRDGLRGVLEGEWDVRPYVATRMPRFGIQNVGHLPELLERVDCPEKLAAIEPDGRSPLGRQIVGAGGKACIACHGVKGTRSIGIPGMDLSQMHGRIRREWFHEFVRDPTRFKPGTRMPPLMADAKARDIEHVWTYLKELDQMPLPEGMVKSDAYELKPGDRPILLRTFMKGVGARTIAVGYPGGLNAAFDQDGVRWALVWHGRFLDAEGTWFDRFTPPAEPLGEGATPLPAHVPFAVLASDDAAWPKVSGARFTGYTLDDARRPSMTYLIGETRVTDTLWPADDGKSFIRTLHVTGETPGLYFRGIADDAPRRVEFTEGTATIREEIKW